ncbi:cytochrome P450 [Streptomyces sp. NPDC059679]|uniref:cytochrome P450 n=1 Tax=Streptomyces sp. NPDC059679 TaxID=3346903 RepID=UPI003676934F
MNNQSAFTEPPPGCPAHNSGRRVPMYGPEFAADPQAFYNHMRHYGPTAPVELAPGVDATLVTDYSAALQLLQNPDTFRKDSRRWRDLNEGKVAPNNPVLPMLAYRPNALFTDGAEHMRLRQAVTDSLAGVDAHWLSRQVERVSSYLISQFSALGEADLLSDYAKMLPLLVFNELFGCSPSIGDRLVSGTSGIFDASMDAEKANQELTQALIELVALKRRQPGDDVTSRLMAHPAKLTDEEMIHQLVMLISAGTEPQRNLIANGLFLLLCDEKHAGGSQAGGLLVEDVIDDVLWNSPPMANYAPHYPVCDVELGGNVLRAGDLVLISFAAANTDPALSSSRQVLSKRAHLAWSAGPHACPAKDLAQLIAVSAIENLLNQLPDVELSVPMESLQWRPGPFHRALTSLPARFAPVRAQQASMMAPAAQPTGPAVTPAAVPQTRTQGKAQKGSVWSSFLAWWKS